MEDQRSLSNQISFERYHLLASELACPISEELDLEIRLELYKSKFIYLNIIFRHFFKELNKSNPKEFLEDKLLELNQTIKITREFYSQALEEKLKNSIDLCAQHLQAQQKDKFL